MVWFESDLQVKDLSSKPAYSQLQWEAGKNRKLQWVLWQHENRYMEKLEKVKGIKNMKFDYAESKKKTIKSLKYENLNYNTKSFKNSLKYKKKFNNYNSLFHPRNIFWSI